MSGVSGNVAWLMGAKQTAKGAVAVPALGTTYKFPYVSGAIGPSRAIGTLAETDSSRDRGVSFVQTGGVDGAPEVYARDSGIGFLLSGCLGADAVTGTTPNFTHAITPANSLPYNTFWNDIGDLLFEQYQDCFIDQLNIKAAAGQPLTATATINGLKSTRLTTDPSLGPPVIPMQNGYVYNFNDLTVTLSGGATALVSNFDMTINNNVNRQQTDDFAPLDVIAGTREVDLSFDLIFANLSEYNAFNYGSTSGTAVTNQLYTTSADFQFDNGTNNQVKFTFPSIAYDTFPVASNTTGAPIVVSVKGVAQRGGSPVVTATIKNQVASY